MSSILDIKAYGHTGTVVEDDGIYTGKIIRDSDQDLVWVDGCDVEDEMIVWVLDAFMQCAGSGKMPNVHYGDEVR